LTRPGRTYYPAFVVALLAGISLFNLLDQSILPAVVASIQTEFHLNDGEVGLLLSVEVAATAITVIPIGYWVDRGSRRMIIGLGTAVWSVATLLTGATGSIAQLLGVRTVLGIGDATLAPTTTSLIGDYFTSRARGRAMAAVLGAAGLGIGAGVLVGGLLGQRFGWRAAFYLAAIPGLVLALIAFTIREPLRGSAESAGPRVAATQDAGLRAFGRLLKVRTYAAVLAAGAFSNFAYSTFSLSPLYAHRRFGLDIAQAGALVGVPMLLGVVVAVPALGWIVDRRARTSPRAAAEVGTLGLFLTAAAAALAFAAPSVGVFEVGLIIGALVSGAGLLAGAVSFQNVVAPSLRGSAVAVSVTANRLFSAIGPIAAGLVSTSLHQNLGMSLLLLAPTALVAAAACFGFGSATMKRDVEAMESEWAQRGSPVPSSSEPQLSTQMSTELGVPHDVAEVSQT
jgi:MFS family permease